MLLLLVMLEKSISIPTAASRTLVLPMLAVPAVDPASAPVKISSSAVGAAPNVTLSPRAFPAASLVPRSLIPTTARSIPVPRVAFAPGPPR